MRWTLPVFNVRGSDRMVRDGIAVHEVARAIRHAEERDVSSPGIRATGGAGGFVFQGLACAEGLRRGEGGSNVQVLEVGLGAYCLLHSGQLHLALGPVGALAVGADAKEDNSDESEEEGDDQADFNQGHAGGTKTT